MTNKEIEAWNDIGSASQLGIIICKMKLKGEKVPQWLIELQESYSNSANLKCNNLRGVL